MAKDKPFRLDVVQQKSDPAAAPDTSSETRKMTGFRDIKDVAAAAPASPSGGDFATPAKSSKTGATGKRQTAAQKEEETKNAAVEEALAKVGIEMMRELASLPYEAWAVFFSDPNLKLTEEQAKTLSNSYFLIAKAIKPEAIASWKILVALAMLQNTRIVLIKLREHDEYVKRMKKIAAAAMTGDNVDSPQVSLV